jgi:hypothetical protein
MSDDDEEDEKNLAASRPCRDLLLDLIPLALLRRLVYSS